MTPQSHFVQPPRPAVWLLTLFALDKEAESILGDLLEEYSLLASRSGVPFARRWYWRQSLKTILQLALLGFRTAPWLTAAAVFGGFFLRPIAGRLVERLIFSAIEKYHVYDQHFSTYVFLATTGIDIGFLITFLLVGFMVALVARGREMVATTTLSLIFGAMVAVAVPSMVMQMGYGVALSRLLLWNSSDLLAIITAGAIVRTYRLGTAARHQQA